MIWLAAPPTIDAQAAHMGAIAKIFNDACVLGRLQLPAGNVVRLTENPNFGAGGRALGLSVPVESKTYLRLKEPANTYVSMISFKRKNGSSIASTCTISTNLLTQNQAYYIFAASSPDRKPTRAIPFILRRWEVDFPERGYRKTLEMQADKWSLFTVETRFENDRYVKGKPE